MASTNDEQITEKGDTNNKISRKSFFKYAGASAASAVALGLYGCDDDSPTDPMDDTVSLGAGNVGILNFAYALEQLETAFYTKVVNNPYGFQGDEENIFTDIMEHERSHRDWFKAVLGKVAGEKRIPSLTPNFDSVDFSSRSEVLATAMALEDTGVGAYNGAGPAVDTGTESGTTYLVEAGKIVSVEARHAAAVRDLINPKSADFAGDDIVDKDSGLGTALTVPEALKAAGGFIKEELDASMVGK